jgi:AcrR family transcriptional regulator
MRADFSSLYFHDNWLHPMNKNSNLRTRQKEERRKRIMDAARDLFVKRGFSASTIKDIAAAATVSPPTVHKYYGTKQQLLFDLVIDSDEENSISMDEKITAAKNPVDAASIILTQIVQGSLKHMDRETWLHVFSVFSNGSEDQTGQRFDAVLNLQYDRLEDLFRDLVERQKLAPNFDRTAARELFQIVNSSLFRKLLVNEITLEKYQTKIFDFVRLVVGSYVLPGPCVNSD